MQATLANPRGFCAGVDLCDVSLPAAHMASQSGAALSSGGSVPCCVDARRNRGALRRARGTSGAAGGATAARAKSLINAMLEALNGCAERPAAQQQQHALLCWECSPWRSALHDQATLRAAMRGHQCCTTACRNGSRLAASRLAHAVLLACWHP